jgi:large subunit ribosomal protein L17
MRHRKVGRKFGRESHQRTALLRSLSSSLIKYEKIVTTVPKAKDLRRYIERAITLAKNEGADKCTELSAFFHSTHDKELVGRDAIKKFISNLKKEDREKVEKYMEDPAKNEKPDFILGYMASTEKRKNGPRILRIEGLMTKLIKRIAPRFKEVPGGYTKIYKIGGRRGDNAEMAVIQFSI